MRHLHEVSKADIRRRQIHLLLTKTVKKERNHDGYRGATVTVHEGMTAEEKEMALYEGFLREAYPDETASLKAKQWIAFEKWPSLLRNRTSFQSSNSDRIAS
jgi:hypothetical protein